MNEKHKKILYLTIWTLGHSLAIMMCFIMLLIFVLSYLGGQYAVIVTTNDYNEFWPEMILLLVGIPCFIVSSLWHPYIISIRVKRVEGG